MGLRKSDESPGIPLENSSSRPPSRKRLIVNPQFQAIFALYAIVTTLLMVPIFIVENVYFFSLFSSKAHVLGLPLDHELMHFVERQQSLMVVFFIGATILAIAMNVVFSYIFSNRIAGSLYRLMSVINQTASLAQAKKISGRKFDFFQDLYAAYNNLLDRLKS